MAVGDLNGDGLAEVLATSDAGAFRWLTVFQDVDDLSGRLAELPEQTGGVVLVDVEGDGDLDVHVLGYGASDRLYLQQDAQTFVDVAAARGLAGGAEERTVSASWADADGDGDLDVFVANYGGLGGTRLPDGDPSHLYLQQDDGTFVDALAELPDNHNLKVGHAFLGGWLQLDGDPRPSSTWSTTSASAREPRPAGHGHDHPGAAVPRLRVHGHEHGSGPGRPERRRARGHGGARALQHPRVPERIIGWYEASQPLGIVVEDGVQEVGWGSEMADLDNDGDLDVLVAFGNLDQSARIDSNPWQQPDAVYRQDALGFVDVAQDWGLDQTGVGRGFVVADLDHDGWLDVVKADVAGPTTLHAGRCGDDAWLGLSLRQAGKNPLRHRGHGRGPRWRRDLDARDAGRWHVLWQRGPPEVHVGLGDRDRVDRVVVRWPDGHRDEALDVDLRRWGTVVRGDAL